MSNPKESGEMSIPSLNEIIQSALQKFQMQEFTEESGELEAYSPFYASWDAVESSLKTGIDAVSLAVKLSQETRLSPKEIWGFSDLSMRGFKNWDDFFFQFSQVIVYGHLIQEYPEVISEYKERRNKV